PRHISRAGRRARLGGVRHASASGNGIFPRSGPWTRLSARPAASNSFGWAHTPKAARLYHGKPCASTSRARAARIKRGNGTPTGHTGAHALQLTHSDCGPAFASRPWWNGVLTSPIAPE